jgi:hypothetical protein
MKLPKRALNLMERIHERHGEGGESDRILPQELRAPEETEPYVIQDPPLPGSWSERFQRRYVYDPENGRHYPRYGHSDAPWDVRLSGWLQRLWHRLSRRPMPPYLQPGWEPKKPTDP